MDTLALLRELEDGITRLARKRSHRTKFDPSDLVQEGFLAALTVVNRYPDKTEKEVLQIAGAAARNRINDVLRHEVRSRTKAELPEFPDSGYHDTKCPDPTSYSQVADLLLAIELRLNDSGRRILREKLRSGLRDAEVADNLGLSRSTVCRALSRAGAAGAELDLP